MRGNMQKLTHAQEMIMIKDLQRMLIINDIQAREILTQTQWNLQKASNTILEYQNRGQQIEQQFNKYLAKGETCIGDYGIQLFCSDLGIDIMDPIILYISYQFKAEKMGVYTKFDFLYGFQNMRCQSTLDLKRLIPKMREDMNRVEVLKNVYRFSFDFAKQNKKDIQFLVAQGLWETLLKNVFPIMLKFLQYLESIPEEKRINISRDTYYMVWEFCVQIGSDLSKYDYLTGAWPTFIDEFYFYMHPENRQK